MENAQEDLTPRCGTCSPCSGTSRRISNSRLSTLTLKWSRPPRVNSSRSNAGRGRRVLGLYQQEDLDGGFEATKGPKGMHASNIQVA